MTRHYLPRPGSYPEKAIAALKDKGAIGPKKIHSGVLARLIGCPVSSLPRVLEFAITHGVIVLERRAHQGNWYGLPEDEPAGIPASRELPPSSVFDLGLPPREMAIRRNASPVRTTLVGRARFAVWSDGDIQIDRGRQSMTLTGDEARELRSLVGAATVAGA
jgi:hypothetical protein